MRSHFVGSVLLLLVFLLANLSSLSANQDYANQTQKTCAFCHRDPNGGPLSDVGIGFVRNGYRYPIPERILDKAMLIGKPFYRILRLIIGYIHLAAASVLVGAIFYVHIIIKPKSLVGIPKGESLLGFSCMSTLAVTGIYLTWYRIDSFSSFFMSRFGALLLLKIVLFAVLVTLGIFAIKVIGRRMLEQAKRAQAREAPDVSGFDVRDLSRYDGQDGRPSYILYKNTVYDVTNSEKWREGMHFRRHPAGRDLTESLEGAPHGDEAFSGIPVVATTSGDMGESQDGTSKGLRRVFTIVAFINLVLVFLILLCVGGWTWGFPLGDRLVSVRQSDKAGASCLGCHEQKKPALAADWQRSIHAKVGVGCSDCHKVADRNAVWVSSSHFQHTEVPVSGLVTPKRCAQCHQDEVDQYARSKHANTLRIIDRIDKWLIHGMNNNIERATGCFACHGSAVRFKDGRPIEGTWPNVGVGRQNPDGSLGSCTSCHTRHRFSVVEARKPEACGQCHLGPDHPQIEIYNESKHGAIYHAEGDEWTWRPEDFHWRAGRDYRAPTCASCHMSEAGVVEKSHDVTERLAWELQAPLTIRPSDFAPFPATSEWQEERRKMKEVCLQCHSETWVNGHFDNLDRVVENYNTLYYKPVKDVMDNLYASGLLSEDSYFDEELEWEFYELWHHEGRRARMGAAMMAPDYAWWHGFYELKHRFVIFMERAEKHTEQNISEWRDQYPGRSD